MKNIVIVVFVLFLLAGGAYYFLTQTQTSPNGEPPISQTQTNSIEPAEENDLGQGGSSFLDPKGVYSFLYPNDYQLDTSDELHPRIFKQGATQRGQTEMYDGVIVVFETIDLDGKTLEQWVDDYIRTVPADGTSTVEKPKEKITVNGYSGFTYSIRGLGVSEYIVIQKDSNSPNAVSITYMVADPENVGFQKEVDSILSTIELLK